MNLAERVKRARETAKLTKSELARAAGVSPSAVTQWESGETQTLSGEPLLRAAAACGVDPNWLGGLSGGHLVREPLPEGKYVYVPEYVAMAGLSGGRFNDDHVEVAGHHAYRADFIRENGWDVARLAVMYGEGDSMSPRINAGDKLLVNMAENDPRKIVSGRVYALEDADHGVRVKRLIRQLDGRILVRSDNLDKSLYPDEYLTPETGARIIGRVVDRSGPV